MFTLQNAYKSSSFNLENPTSLCKNNYQAVDDRHSFANFVRLNVTYLPVEAKLGVIKEQAFFNFDHKKWISIFRQ